MTYSMGAQDIFQALVLEYSSLSPALASLIGAASLQNFHSRGLCPSVVHCVGQPCSHSGLRLLSGGTTPGRGWGHPGTGRQP